MDAFATHNTISCLQPKEQMATSDYTYVAKYCDNSYEMDFKSNSTP